METDVVVVGAGPTGLLLAGDLAGAGINCVVLERRAEESNLSRAFGVHARTLEELDARGLADDLIATGQPISAFQLFGHVALDLSTLPTRFPYLLITPQYNVERLLERRARELGATIVTGAEMTTLRQSDTGVEVETAAGETCTARYVVGADGVGSKVRQAVGLDYPGIAALRSIMLADVRLAEKPPDVLVVSAANDCFAFMAPFGDGWYRIFCWDYHHQVADDAPLDFEEVKQTARKALGEDFGMHDPRWISRFHSDERQVAHYRVGRVFLAGDAAHCHSPAGAQGMNTGLQDAANLSWKLAAAVKGWAPEGLLDSYNAERHPVGKEVIRGSGTLVRLATLRPWVERVARDLLGGTLSHLPTVQHKVAGALSGIGIHYPAPRGAHPLVGRRVADLPLAGGGRVYESLRSGRFLLLGPSDVTGWADRVDTARADTPLTLIRPDGYVAWAGEDPSGLPEALTTWCGPPAGA
ncbi:MAG: FAD-dependent oxidoreductase [Nonomuraea sp.]|nr:FAD-dependent oxidoreductase [Nonomuraea sp.]